MTIEDIYHTLQELDMISVQAATPPMRPTPGQAIKFPRGRKNGIARRHLQRQSTVIKEDEAGSKANTPFAPPTLYQITWDPEKVQRYLESWEKKGYMKLKPERLKWTPFVLARAKAGGEVLQSELGAGMGALSSIAETPAPVTLVDNQVPAPDTAELSINVSEVPRAGTRDVSDSPAARLFDDLLLKHPETPIPKKQLRNRLKGEVPRSVLSRTQSSRNSITHPTLQRHTHSESARPVTGIDGAVNCATIQTDHASPDIPAKRRRERAYVNVSSAVSESGEMTASPSPSRPSTRVKRRRIVTPESDAPVEHLEGNDELPCAPDGKLPLPNGAHQKENVPHPSSVPSSSRSINNGVHSSRPETTSSTSEPDTRSSLAQSQPPENAVKSEDADTPLTSITSRHSVPSDDTLFVAENANGVGRKDPGDSDITRAMDPENTERKGAQNSVHLSGCAVDDIDQYSDMDAEGEPDDEIG